MWQAQGFEVKNGLEVINNISMSQKRVVIGSNGEAQEVLLRVPVGGQIAVIDALNFVVSPETFDTNNLTEKLSDPATSDDEKRKLATDTACHVANVLQMIMGDEFADINDTGVSRNRYRYTFRIGHHDCPLGLIGIGNFNTTKPSILVMIYGEGCHFAEEYWEFRLHQWLTTSAIDPRITRCDVCHDDFDGLYSSAELADDADTNGGFALTNKLPNVQHLGDWKRHEGRGRTLQVGQRQNGKCYRGYEKGKQLGNSESAWFRHEVEIGNKARIIPLDILKNPSEYFAGAYPYTCEISQYAYGHSNFTSSRIKTVKASTSISIQKSVDVVKRQFGRYIKVLRDIFEDDAEILDLIQTEKQDYYPKRLRLFEKLIFRPPSYVNWFTSPFNFTSYKDHLRGLDYAI